MIIILKALVDVIEKKKYKELQLYIREMDCMILWINSFLLNRDNCVDDDLHTELFSLKFILLCVADNNMPSSMLAVNAEHCSQKMMHLTGRTRDHLVVFCCSRVILLSAAENSYILHNTVNNWIRGRISSRLSIKAKLHSHYRTSYVTIRYW